MFRPRTQSRPGYGKPISSTVVVPTLEDPLGQETLSKVKGPPAGAYSVRSFVDFYKAEQSGDLKISSTVVPYPRALSVTQEWARAEDERIRVAAALRRATPMVSELDLFKEIYRSRAPYLPDSISAAGDAISAAAMAAVGRTPGPISEPGVVPGTEPGVVPGTQPGSQQSDFTGQPAGVLPPGPAPDYDPEERPNYDPESIPGTLPVVRPPATQPSGTVPVVRPPSTIQPAGTVPVITPPSTTQPAGTIPVVTRPITVPIPGQIDTTDPVAAATAISTTEATATTSGLAAPTLAERAQLDDQVYGYRTIPVQVPRPDMQVVASVMVRANRVLFDGLNPSEAYKFVQAAGTVGTYTALHTLQSLRSTALFQYVISNAPTVLNLGAFIPPTVADWLYVETAYVLLQRYDSTKTTANTPDEVTAAMAYAKVQILGYYSNKVLMGLHALIWKGMPGDEAFLTQAIDIAKRFPSRGDAQLAAVQYIASYVESSAIAHAIITARDRSQFTSSMLNFLGFFSDVASSIESGLKSLSSILGTIFLTGDMVNRGRQAVYDFVTTPSGAASALLQFVGSAYFAQNRLFTWSCILATNYGMMSGYRMAAYLIWRVLFGMARQGHLVNPIDREDQLLTAAVRDILVDMQREVAANPQLAVVAENVVPALLNGLAEGLEPTQLIEDVGGRDQGALSIVSPSALLFVRRMEFLGNLVLANTKSSVRDEAKEAMREILAFWNVPEGTIETILTEMSSLSTPFQFLKLDTGGATVLSSPTLLTYLDTNAESINRLMVAELGNKETVLGLMGNFARPFSLAKSNIMYWPRFAAILGTLFGATASQVATIPADSIDDPLKKTDTPAQVTPAPAPARVEGSATMTSVPTPQFTDAPATMSLESAMSQLADRTLSVQQVTRSGLPDSYSWWLIKARRRTLRALFFAAFTGLGATPADATQTLNFMDPTFVDVSLNEKEYSGLRIQGRHGSYPRLDAFFLKYFDVFSKYFAGLSSQIRVSYASTFATRIFGLRGKTYFTKMFALSQAELSQVAKNSVAVLDIVTGDTTFSDSTPQGPAPTTEEARGYGTGPYDYVGPR